MVDHETECCMCGDVGFPAKLFRCSKCRNRFQHSYCSNYYGEDAEVCDWCQCEQKNNSSSIRHNNNNNNNNNNINSSSHSSPRNNNKPGHTIEVRSAYSGDKTTKQEGGSSAERAIGKSPSPRTPTRRYKLLKDVMC